MAEQMHSRGPLCQLNREGSDPPPAPLISTRRPATTPFVLCRAIAPACGMVDASTKLSLKLMVAQRPATALPRGPACKHVGRFVAGLTWCQTFAAPSWRRKLPEGPDVPLDESSVVVEPEDVQEIRRTSDLEIGEEVREKQAREIS